MGIEGMSGSNDSSHEDDREDAPRPGEQSTALQEGADPAPQDAAGPFMQQDVASFMSAEGEALGTSEGVALGTHEVESRLEAAKVEDLRAQLDRLSISEVEDYLQNRKTLSKAPSLASQTSSIAPTTGSVNGTIADRRATLFEQLRPFGYQGRGLLLRPFVQRPSLQLPNGKRESSMGFPNCGGNVSSTGAMTETQTSTNAPAAGAMDKTAAP